LRQMLQSVESGKSRLREEEGGEEEEEEAAAAMVLWASGEQCQGWAGAQNSWNS
jgi:hypothetical protein